MDKKIIIMGGLAVVFGGLSIFAADYWLQSNIRTEVVEVEKPVETVRQETFATIVVASDRLIYGERVSRGNLAEIPWPQDRLPEGAYKTIDEVVADGNRSALGAIEMNEPVLASKITGPDSKPSLSNKLKPGMRAVAVQVDEFTAVSGFVVPGDRVDVAVTRRLRTNLGPSPLEPTDNSSDVISSIVVENVKVLTVGQNFDDSEFEPVVSRSVTLEVDQAQARKISAAQETGTVALHLRKAGEARQPIEIDFTPTASYDGPPEGSSTVTIAVRHGSELHAVDVRKEGH